MKRIEFESRFVSCQFNNLNGTIDFTPITHYVEFTHRKKKDMQRHEKFDHGDDLSTRLTILVEKLEMLMTTISRNQGLNMGPNS